MAFYTGVGTRGFLASFPGRQMAIEYVPADGQSLHAFEIWSSVEVDTQTSVKISLTTLEIATGGGKTTFANHLYDFLEGNDEREKSFFWLVPSPARVGAFMIPQRLSTARHWKMDRLLPRECTFEKCVFTEEEFSNLRGKRLSEMSGGQVARLLLLSVLERIHLEEGVIPFLIVDEGFEGIDEALANKILKSLFETWSKAKDIPLRMLLITHFNPATLLDGITCRRITLQHEATESKPLGDVAYLVNKVSMSAH